MVDELRLKTFPMHSTFSSPRISIDMFVQSFVSDVLELDGDQKVRDMVKLVVDMSLWNELVVTGRLYLQQDKDFKSSGNIKCPHIATRSFRGILFETTLKKNCPSLASSVAQE